jgi:hypothetical protein
MYAGLKAAYAQTSTVIADVRPLKAYSFRAGLKKQARRYAPCTPGEPPAHLTQLKHNRPSKPLNQLIV